MLLSPSWESHLPRADRDQHTPGPVPSTRGPELLHSRPSSLTRLLTPTLCTPQPLISPFLRFFCLRALVLHGVTPQPYVVLLLTRQNPEVRVQAHLPSLNCEITGSVPARRRTAPAAIPGSVREACPSDPLPLRTWPLLRVTLLLETSSTEHDEFPVEKLTFQILNKPFPSGHPPYLLWAHDGCGICLEEPAPGPPAAVPVHFEGLSDQALCVGSPEVPMPPPWQPSIAEDEPCLSLGGRDGCTLHKAGQMRGSHPTARGKARPQSLPT